MSYSRICKKTTQHSRINSIESVDSNNMTFARAFLSRKFQRLSKNRSRVFTFYPTNVYQVQIRNNVLHKSHNSQWLIGY